jgi:hypothetical protein
VNPDPETSPMAGIEVTPERKFWLSDKRWNNGNVKTNSLLPAGFYA